MVVAQMQEEKRGSIGRENINGATLGRTETAAPMAPTPSLVETGQKKKRPTQRIGREIAEAATVY